MKKHTLSSRIASATVGAGLLGGGLLSAATVDLMVVYTDNVKNANGGDAGARAAINAAVAASNDTFQRSNLPTRLRLVHSQSVNYQEGEPGADLRNLRNRGDGQMDEVHQIRDEKGADLVALIADSAKWGRTAGIGYIGNGNSASYGFSATGFRFTASGGTFAHEIGHNLGCQHDADNAGTSGPAYAKGWRFTGDSGRQHRTTMAYAPGRRISHFSDPDINFDGKPTGVAGQADNARRIAETDSGTANYRPTRVGSNPTTPTQPPAPQPPAIDSKMKEIFGDPTGDGSKTNTWMGSFVNIKFPNVNHQFIGQMRLWDRSTSDRLYFNSSALGGWVYTTKSVWPRVYRFSDQQWLRYEVGSRNPRIFYNFRTGQNERL